MSLKYLHIVLLVLISVSATAQNSVLSTGQWYKVSVDKNGIYRITADQLRRMGFNTTSLDPRRIRIYGMEGGMLPQPNSSPRPADLQELAIHVEGESDAVFNTGDFVLFYAQGPHSSRFLPGKLVFAHGNNLYSNENYYFITVGNSNGKRITISDAGNGGATVNTFEDYIHHEAEEYNLLESGREWYGENFSFSPDQSFRLEIPGLTGANVRLVSHVMAQALTPTTFKIYFNDQPVLEQLIDRVVNSTYATKGKTKADTVTFTPTGTGAATHTIRYAYQRSSSTDSKGFLNFFSLHFTRALALYGDQTAFRSAVNANTACLFNVGNMSLANEIWNVTDPYTPRRQQFQLQGSTAVFSSQAGNGISPEYIVFNQKHAAPRLVGPVPNQDLHAISADYIIVTHPDFAAQAQRLATHRAQLNNWSTAVVTPEQIYNEFSSGRQDVTAIRDFIRYVHDKSPGKLKSLLLFGKSSYDYKNRILNNTNLVPTYESRNSLSPLDTYSSDDYFVFLDPEEGEWAESPLAPDHTLDIGIGRLPVKSAAEAAAMVDKLIDYDNNPAHLARWRKDIVFVADDGSTTDNWSTVHQGQANSLAEAIETEHEAFNTRKIFLGTYTKDVYAFGERMPRVNREIRDEFERALIINYTGHGAEEILADEYILTAEDVALLENKNHPFLVTATCEFGRHDNPVLSTAELTLLKPKAGCIGMVTTARPVNSSPNFALNKAFYDALFSAADPLAMGEVFRLTKNNSTSGVSNRNFSLLGDPGMKLAIPRLKVEVTELRTASGSETLKALSTVIIRGRITDNGGAIVTTFNGIVNAGLFDKETEFVTIGRNVPAYRFSEWHNPLFRGNAVVKDGEFEISFIVPRNIAYEIGPGKLSLYAWNKEKTLDAAGGTTSFNIGGSETGVPMDTTPPQIEVYMGDSTFVNGGRVSPNTTLVVKVFDESGINISNYGIGNTAMAILDDDTEAFIINEYYEAVTGTFTKGWIRFPIEGLSPGRHTITVKVWDVFNNPTERIVDFVVSETDLIEIEEFGNYPNPFPGVTTFFFKHNRSGDDLNINLELLNITGQRLKEWQIFLPSGTYRAEFKFDDSNEFGQKLTPGLYFGRITVRSLSDGGESSAVTKLIVSN